MKEYFNLTANKEDMDKERLSHIERGREGNEERDDALLIFSNFDPLPLLKEYSVSLKIPFEFRIL